MLITLSSYPDVRVYKKKNGKDSFNNIKYDNPVKRNFRYTKGYSVTVPTKTGEGTEYRLIYHSMFEVFNGDLIDDKVVDQVMPCRKAGKAAIEYWKVVVK